jgi:hypothetical protein
MAAAAMPLAAWSSWAVAADRPPALAAPFKVEADGKPIDVDIGHAAPFLADFDGDGKPDLLVGQFDEGKLRIYANAGDARSPAFRNFTWFKAGADFGVVPSS